MNGYQIITDSTTDLSPALAEELGIEIIPMEITLSGASYLQFPDERALSNRTFYERLASGETATTNQINATTFTETFERYLQAGTDVLYIGFSSGLSGTYNNSRLAAQELSEKYPGRRILVLDSLAASMGEGLLVYHAVQKQREGMGIDELASWVEANRNRLAHWFTVDDLNFLKRGGRVSGAAALFGTMLGIKPVLHVDNDGHLIPVGKGPRAQKCAGCTCQPYGESRGASGKPGDFLSAMEMAPEDAEYVAKQVKARFSVPKVYINYIGPVIGSHAGPGTVALFFLGKSKD